MIIYIYILLKYIPADTRCCYFVFYKQITNIYLLSFKGEYEIENQKIKFFLLFF